MLVIPAINCSDIECFNKRLEQIGELGSEWVHIDVSDGNFNSVSTFDFSKIPSGTLNHLSKMNIEVHFMVNDTFRYITEWYNFGIEFKRVIIHLESSPDLAKIFDFCSERGIKVMLASSPNTSVSEVLPYLGEFDEVQVLAVEPGLSGQEFNEGALEKVKCLRERVPDLMIEVDGGINPDTLRDSKIFGADIAVSASYIFNSSDFRKAYGDLLAAGELEE